METLIGIAGVVLGAVAGTIATYLTTRSKMRWELVYAYDRELREKRLPHYQNLFHLSGTVPREWRPDAVPARTELWKIRELFHDWYFGTDAGGMFLSEAARDRYFALQNGLQTVAGPDPSAGEAGEPLTSAEQATLYQLASALRHQLSSDVGTAQSPRLEWARPGPTLAAPSRAAAADHRAERR